MATGIRRANIHDTARLRSSYRRLAATLSHPVIVAALTITLLGAMETSIFDIISSFITLTSSATCVLSRSQPTRMIHSLIRSMRASRASDVKQREQEEVRLRELKVRTCCVDTW